jgi:hypothetical protein
LRRHDEAHRDRRKRLQLLHVPPPTGQRPDQSEDARMREGTLGTMIPVDGGMLRLDLK